MLVIIRFYLFILSAGSLSGLIAHAQSTAKTWSANSITSMSSFGHIIKIAFGNGNQAFVKNPVGSDSVIQIR